MSVKICTFCKSRLGSPRRFSWSESSNISSSLYPTKSDICCCVGTNGGFHDRCYTDVYFGLNSWKLVSCQLNIWIPESLITSEVKMNKNTTASQHSRHNQKIKRPDRQKKNGKKRHQQGCLITIYDNVDIINIR